MSRDFKRCFLLSCEYKVAFFSLVYFVQPVFLDDMQSEVQEQYSHSSLLRTREVCLLFYCGLMLSGWTGPPWYLRQKINSGAIFFSVAIL